jgi:hypothetical protein
MLRDFRNVWTAKNTRSGFRKMSWRLGQIGITGTPVNILLHSQTGEAVMKFGALPLEAFKPDIDKMLR